MMKVFLDTNILLDYGEVRDDFVYAKAIMELGERGEVELFASYLSYANMGYILRHYPKEELWPLIKDMREGINVLPTDCIQLDAFFQGRIHKLLMHAFRSGKKPLRTEAMKMQHEMNIADNRQTLFSKMLLFPVVWPVMRFVRNLVKNKK